MTAKLNNTIIKCLAPEELKRELERLAQARNISLSALLRLILSEYVKQKG
jgi:predicted transcriptional regulator